MGHFYSLDFWKLLRYGLLARSNIASRLETARLGSKFSLRRASDFPHQWPHADSGVKRSLLRNHPDQFDYRNELADCGISEFQRAGKV